MAITKSKKRAKDPQGPKPDKRPKRPEDTRWKLVGERIRADREAKGFKQVELAARLGHSQMQQWRWEDGQVVIPLKRLERVAEILDQPLERYIPADTRPQAKLSPAQLRALHEQLATAAMRAALSGTDEAIDALNELIAQHYYRTGR